MLNRKILLACMTRHETLTIDDIRKAENLGFVPNPRELKLLLNQLTESGEMIQLLDVLPVTYAITSKGIAAGR